MAHGDPFTKDLKALQWLQDHCYEKLSKWEQGFVDDLLDRWENGFLDDFSFKQSETIDKMWEKYVVKRST